MAELITCFIRRAGSMLIRKEVSGREVGASFDARIKTKNHFCMTININTQLCYGSL